MILKIFPTKDTFITNKINKNSVPTSTFTGSNVGYSPILQVFKLAGISGAIGVRGSSSLCRSLLNFDLSEFSDLTASGKAPSTGYSAILRLRNVNHKETVPSSVDLEISPITTDWDEGKGLDTDTYKDLGYANWDKAKSNVFWTTAGGDILTTPTGSYHLDTGLEDVLLDITNIVDAWLTGGLNNYGILVRLTGSAENDLSDYYTKKFYSRESHFKDKRPCIEFRWDDSIKDDRNKFLFDVTGNLYLYNVIEGQLTNLSAGTGSNILSVTIADASGNLQTASGSFTGITGIYSASFALATGSYSGSLFTDAWGSGSYSYFTGSFTPSKALPVQTLTRNEYIVSIENLNTEYELCEDVRLNLHIRKRDYKPAIVATASIYIPSDIIKKGYYRIDNEYTKEQVIQFGTGSLEWSRLSYDENGNYFNIKMSSLSDGNVYRILFLFDENGNKTLIDEDFKFKVV